MLDVGKNFVKLDTSGFDRLLEAIEDQGKDVKPIIDLTLKHAAVKIQNQTVLAVQLPNYPKQGKYSTGETSKAVIHFPQIEWEGDTASVGVGFDNDDFNASNFLIKGTPRMKPDKKLYNIFVNRKFINSVQKGMWDEVMDELEKVWEKKI